MTSRDPPSKHLRISLSALGLPDATLMDCHPQQSASVEGGTSGNNDPPTRFASGSIATSVNMTPTESIPPCSPITKEGSKATSAAYKGRSSAPVLWRMFLTVLIVAGVVIGSVLIGQYVKQRATDREAFSDYQGDRVSENSNASLTQETEEVTWMCQDPQGTGKWSIKYCDLVSFPCDSSQDMEKSLPRQLKCCRKAASYGVCEEADVSACSDIWSPSTCQRGMRWYCASANGQSSSLLTQQNCEILACQSESTVRCCDVSTGYFCSKEFISTKEQCESVLGKPIAPPCSRRIRSLQEAKGGPTSEKWCPVWSLPQFDGVYTNFDDEERLTDDLSPLRLHEGPGQDVKGGLLRVQKTFEGRKAYLVDIEWVSGASTGVLTLWNDDGERTGEHLLSNHSNATSRHNFISLVYAFDKSMDTGAERGQLLVYANVHSECSSNCHAQELPARGSGVARLVVSGVRHQIMVVIDNGPSGGQQARIITQSLATKMAPSECLTLPEHRSNGENADGEDTVLAENDLFRHWGFPRAADCMASSTCTEGSRIRKVSGSNDKELTKSCGWPFFGRLQLNLRCTKGEFVIHNVQVFQPADYSRCFSIQS